MVKIDLELKFGGYWRDTNRDGVPNDRGVYCVYSCTYNNEKDTVSLNELLFIGEGEKVLSLILQEDYSQWKNNLNSGQELCFTFAPIANGEKKYQKIISDILVLKNHPKYNENVDIPNQYLINLKTTGANALLSPTINYPE